MQHKRPDRVPIDIGGTSLTGMRPQVQKNLRRFLGFPEDPDRQAQGVDERILQWAGTDFRSVGAIIDLPSPHTKTLSPTARIDCWGVRREYSYGEWQITQSPLHGAAADDLKTFTWPEPRVDEALLAAWETRARALKVQNQHVIIAEHPVFGILELGCWMCGYNDFLLKLASDTDFVRRFFDRVFEIQLAVIEQYYGVLGPYIDLTTSGDDYGMQNGPLLSPQMFDALIAPNFAERIRRTKALGQCYYWHHSCGSVVKLLDQIIDCGVDILNPIQTSAAGMDPRSLKDRFGDRLVFWGAVDVQQFLPYAAREEIGPHITELVQVLGEKGGYVIAPAHEILEDIPTENIVAWVETLKTLP